jgi:murein DD-endopeptidase MepM/ murein hydrolase activator NlpD
MVLLLAASLFLAACENAAFTFASPSPTGLASTKASTGLNAIVPPTQVTTPIDTSTSFPSLSLLTPSSRPPTSTPTFTATPIPCNPSSVDYCIQDAFFIFQLPISSSGNEVIDRGYPYGSTESGTREPHHGVEFPNPTGTPVLAAADGTVYYAGDDTSTKFSPWNNFYGNVVIIEHTFPVGPFERLYTLYAHLSRISVAPGQAVSAGEEIGEVGMTGHAFGYHLHFEVRIDPADYFSTLNPELWLIPHTGKGALAILSTDLRGENILPEFYLQYFPVSDKLVAASYPVISYAPEAVNSLDPWQEVAAISDRPTGRYRLTLVWHGVLYEKWIEIQSGKLTLVKFVVNK